MSPRRGWFCRSHSEWRRFRRASLWRCRCTHAWRVSLHLIDSARRLGAPTCVGTRPACRRMRSSPGAPPRVWEDTLRGLEIKSLQHRPPLTDQVLLVDRADLRERGLVRLSINPQRTRGAPWVLLCPDIVPGMPAYGPRWTRTALSPRRSTQPVDLMRSGDVAPCPCRSPARVDRAAPTHPDTTTLSWLDPDR